MARKKSRSRQMLFTAGSEMRKGFTMPTVKKIRSVLMSKSKTFLVNLIITMMTGISKTAKIKILIKIEKGKIVKRAIKRRKAKGKTAKTKKKAKNGRKGKGFAGQVKGSKKEKQMKAKAKRARKRKS